ncbi:MAG TPA: methylmalonyl Co-A mutase-associated GTPase MeaB [Lentimicrobium sp.]|nr:methylmalonyl Co-A mutase-associated GTPase MeaB [Lentimicrobium sp.]
MSETKNDHNQLPSALTEREGIPQPSPINESALGSLKHAKKPLLSVEEYFSGIIHFDRAVFSRAITLLESSLKPHQVIAQELVSRCIPYAGKSFRLGITGVPGAGKSTFIEALGKHVTGLGHKLAVLAIDPSSARSRGSILGDKTRMESLSTDPNAFIRPSPTAGSLGGVARKTREIIILCEAAGFDVIFVETVGVGQSETAVHSMVDFFLLLLISGAGDELQGIKRGIMEMADAVAINKADGDNVIKAQIAANQVKNALHFFPKPESGWGPEVVTCSAKTTDGIPQMWDLLTNYIEFTKDNHFFGEKRKRQSHQVMLDYINNNLYDHFYQDASMKELLVKAAKMLEKKTHSPYQAAQILLKNYFSK